MLAHHNEPRFGNWMREGGVFDLITIMVSLVVIVGGLFIVNTASRNYRMAGYEAPPIAKGLPVMNPTVIPVPNTAPTQ
jgi:hypothetical protein